ncbi:hypothetical protein SAMN04488564_11470 [Lentzea waywayandensis]|uniref:Uncharacterized protein n=1 Tax=Lentzea waywayandensis TaxID=84724 RepID=A0A1I6FEX9_9PSEU|nr:hypothetical protein [Lentzea waywayandensis]SFR28509.1 hypothetical protein SAMN04488564_11470 [Lentzea waywayandensis]
MSDDKLVLDLLDKATVRKRARMVAIGGIMVALAFGAIVGLIGGRWPGVIAGLIVSVPVILLAMSEARRTVWLEGTTVYVRAFGTRKVDLAVADGLDLLVTDLRGARTVGLFVRGNKKAINIALSMYAGTGGRELGVYQLRRLADALAARGDTPGLVFSELLVAQLRAEARGLAAAERPLYRLGSLAPAGRMAQKLHPDAVSKFVTSLD